MHRIEQIFTLGINMHAQFFTFRTQPLFQFAYRQLRPRGVGDDHHRKLPLHYRLVDVDDTATSVGQNLRRARHDSRMIHAKD